MPLQTPRLSLIASRPSRKHCELRADYYYYLLLFIELPFKTVTNILKCKYVPSSGLNVFLLGCYTFVLYVGYVYLNRLTWANDLGKQAVKTR